MSYIYMHTPDSLDYRYFPIAKPRVRLRVKAAHDARISLRTHLGDDSNVYEIIVGGWGNTMSAIKKNDIEPDIAEAETPNILDSSEQCDILIQWACDGRLTVSSENNVLMSYRDRNPFVINYIGLSTAWGATGEWEIDELDCRETAVRQQLVDTSHYWVDFNDKLGLPPDAVVVAEDGLYVGRAYHQESITPGLVRNDACTIVWGGEAHEKKEFQVLCGRHVSWVKSWAGSVPLYALPAGETEDGYALFIGRVPHEGSYIVGKVQPNHQTCYVPENGQEVPHSDCEVLLVHDRTSTECIGR